MIWQLFGPAILDAARILESEESILAILPILSKYILFCEDHLSVNLDEIVLPFLEVSSRFLSMELSESTRIEMLEIVSRTIQKFDQSPLTRYEII